VIDVFVSYRTVDAGYGAAGCYEFFAARFGPDRVFRDCTSVLPGEVYPEAIEKALEETRALVALIGPDWLAAGAEGRRLIDLPGDWVRHEIGRALERGILVVPVLLNDAGALVPSALPNDIRPLAYRQAARVHHRSFGSDVRRLIDQIVELVPELGRSDPAGLTPNLPLDVVSNILPQAGPHLVPSSGAMRGVRLSPARFRPICLTLVVEVWLRQSPGPSARGRSRFGGSDPRSERHARRSGCSTPRYAVAMLS